MNEQPGHPMHQLDHFMNSEEVVEVMRQLTGEAAIEKADCYATLYSPGQLSHNFNYDFNMIIKQNQTNKW